MFKQIKHLRRVRVVNEALFNMKQAWDDVHGNELELKEFGVRWSSMQNAWKRHGNEPVSVTWVSTNKDSEEDTIIRCSLVARYCNVKRDNDKQDLFAATPPLETQRVLLSKLACNKKDGRVKKLLFIDLMKAHLNPGCE